MKQKGLTLIELLAVIAIIAILFILLIPSVSSAFEKARVSGVQTDLHSYEVGLKSYFMENSNGVPTEDKINQYLDKSLQFTSFKSKEKNPWGKPYVLEIDGKNVSISTSDDSKESRLFSLKSGIDESGVQYQEHLGFDTVIHENNDTSNTIDNSNPTPSTPEIDYSSVYEYTISDLGVRIDNYLGSDTVLVIPSKIEGKDVIEIAGTNFFDKKSFYERGLTSVTIPSTVKTIGAYAFSRNALSVINFNEGLVTIGKDAFSRMTGNIVELKIPNSVTTIGASAFTTSYIKKVIFGDNLVSIGADAFSSNQIVGELSFNKLTFLGDSAFTSNKITKVSLPSTLTTVSAYAFQYNELTEVTLAQGIKELKRSAFEYNQISKVTIPSSVTLVEFMTFMNNAMTEFTLLGNPFYTNHSGGSGTWDDAFPYFATKK